MSNQSQSCCAFEGGSKCMAVWCISLSAVGLLFALGSAGYWAWATAIVTIVLFSAVGCVRAGSGIIVAAVAAPFAFLTFILQLAVGSIILTQGSIYCADDTDDYNYSSSLNDYNSCKSTSIALGAIGIVGSVLWLAASIIGAILAYKMSVHMGAENCCGSSPSSAAGTGAHVAGTKQEHELGHYQPHEGDIEVANAVPVNSGSGSIRIVERNMPDGTKVIEKTVINPLGQKTVTVTTHDPHEQESDM